MTTNTKPEVRIDDWSVVDVGRPILQGVVTGHPRIPDGHRVWTSAAVRRSGGDWVETQNTLYLLGTPADPLALIPDEGAGEGA